MRSYRWWSDYHHVIGHNLLFGLVIAGIAFATARKRIVTAALALVSFHLHLVCDLLGARGPDGYRWPIPYLWPFLKSWYWEWSGQWGLDAWPNFVVTGALLVLAFYLAWRRGYSPVGIISPRTDAAFVAALRRRVPIGRERAAGEESAEKTDRDGP